MVDERRYRVLPGPDEESLRFLDRETYEPIVVSTEDSGEPVGDLYPGYLVDAGLDWTDPEPVVRSLSVERPTLYEFRDGVDPVFQVAQETWREAQAANDAMNSQVTRNTDNRVNGVVYVFAEGGDRGRFEEFRDGSRPLEPLLDRVNEREGAAPREVFVLRPQSGEFTIVTITLKKGGQFADTMRDTYGIAEPAEPLA